MKGGDDMEISANIVPNITGTIQRKPVRIEKINDFVSLTENLNLADTVPTVTELGTIDLLIGNDYYLDIITRHKIEVQKGLYLLSSKLGWILSGRTHEIGDNDTDMNMLILTYGANISKTEVFTTVDDSLPTKPNLEDFSKCKNC